MLGWDCITEVTFAVSSRVGPCMTEGWWTVRMLAPDDWGMVRIVVPPLVWVKWLGMEAWDIWTEGLDRRMEEPLVLCRMDVVLVSWRMEEAEECGRRMEEPLEPCPLEEWGRSTEELPRCAVMVGVWDPIMTVSPEAKLLSTPVWRSAKVSPSSPTPCPKAAGRTCNVW